MSDVARRAGVSVSTVSYALTGSRPISEATRARVLRAMSELDYTPNALARGLKSQKSRIIALLCPITDRGIDLSGLEYIVGASDYAQRRGYHLLLWTAELASLADLKALVHQGLVDGVLLMEVRLDDERVALLLEARAPIGLIGRTAEPTDLDFIDADFAQCASVAMRYLAELGHRYAGFVNQSEDLVERGLGNATRAVAAARQAGADHGITLHAMSCDSSRSAGVAAFERLRAEEPRLSAIVAYNEQAVSGLISGALARGWRIPADLSIISIAMSDAAAAMYTPAVTTVSPSAWDMGAAAVEGLVRRLEEPDLPPLQRLSEGVLYVRETTARARS